MVLSPPPFLHIHLPSRANNPGKTWKPPKAPFRPKAGAESWEARQVKRQALAATKQREAEMKAEKEAARAERNRLLRERREAKVEKERYEKLAEKMHVKKVERIRRRERRNKVLKER
ncbi:hypothetical protein L873DRAFT_1847968 [Choiromyces venosus 120613-1]|uniref:rRNA-processing protein n=1 Tax=Choiromyces venosus 120613-1 TaxID=1336337 RepID=A0A3N4J0P8_9PEZI|nr:hypothetical protein L873DRAFT_1847968 [Choiromyces venosus 120613-1]